MSNRFEVPDSSPRALESLGIPGRISSHPLTFVPAPFARRPTPTYPQRTYYANFDPAFPRASFVMGKVQPDSAQASAASHVVSLAEQRAHSEPHTGWRIQSTDVDIRRISVPPNLEVAPLTFRKRLPYPDRTLDQITVWMPLPVVRPRGYGSEPIAEAERLAARPSDRPNDWAYAWPEENDPHQTRCADYENARYTMNGLREGPSETAAVPNENILESIEVEGDPFIAIRNTINDSQVIIRRELDRQVALGDENRELMRRNDGLHDHNEALSVRNQHLEYWQQIVRNDLYTALRERESLQRERDLATNQAERLRLERDEPEEAYRRRQDQQEEHEEAIEEVRRLQQSEANLRTGLNLATTRADRLQRDWNRLDYDREQFEMERDHYWTERDREQRHNRDLQAQNRNLQVQIQSLENQLRAAQAVAVLPPVTAPPVNASPIVPPPVVTPPIVPPPVVPPPVALPPFVQPPVAAPYAHPVRGRGSEYGRGGARGHAGRRGRGAATATRKQPARPCKVEKNYRE